LNFPDRFSKNTHIPLKPIELFREERRRTVGLRELKKLLVAIRNFTKASTNVFKKEAENILKYENVKVETQRMWNVKTKVKPQ